MPVSLLNRPVASSDQHASQSVHKTDWLDVTAGIVNGDDKKFEDYYRATFDLMYREARKLCGRDEATCLDIVQEAMLKAIRSMKPMESWERLAAWSTMVARSTTYDWLRTEISRLQAIQNASENKEANDVNEEDETELQARLTWVEEKLQMAEPELRRLIALRYRTGWTLQRIANAVGLKTGAVDGRIRRAIAELKQQAELEYEEDRSY